MRLVFAFWCCLLWIALLSACDETKTLPTSTQLMLRIDSQDASVIARLTALRVSIALHEADGRWKTPTTASYPKSELRWPVDIPVTPRVPGDADKEFDVLVEALAEGEVVAQTRAVAGFVQGRLLVLELWLFACDPDSDGVVCSDASCRGW